MTHEQPSDGRGHEDFDRIARAETGEPLLGPRQGALIDSLTHRLSSDVPLSEHDLIAAAFLGRVLNLGELQLVSEQ